MYQVLKLLPEYGEERPTKMSETYPPNYTSEGSLIGSGGLITSPSSTSSLTLPKSEIKEANKPLAGKKGLEEFFEFVDFSQSSVS